MENPVLSLLKQAVGQTMERSPSPFGRWLNGTLLEVEEGFAVCSFEVRENMSNPLGLIHGGALAAIADEVIGIASATLNLKGRYVSVSLNTEFLNSAKTGDTILAKARIDRAGKTLIHGSCEILHADKQKVVALATCNLVSITPRTPSGVGA